MLCRDLTKGDTGKMPKILLEQKRKTDAQTVRIMDAKRDLERLQDEIRPFIRRRPLCDQTSVGKWMESSVLNTLKHDANITK